MNKHGDEVKALSDAVISQLEKQRNERKGICPQCKTKMHGVTIVIPRPFKHCLECPNCNYRTEAK